MVGAHGLICVIDQPVQTAELTTRNSLRSPFVVIILKKYGFTEDPWCILASHFLGYDLCRLQVIFVTFFADVKVTDTTLKDRHPFIIRSVTIAFHLLVIRWDRQYCRLVHT